MSLLPASSIGDESTGFYKGANEQSARFNSGSSANLTRTFSTGNKKTFTISFWIKRGAIGSYQNLFDMGSSGSSYHQVRFQDDDQLLIMSENSGVLYSLETSQVFRDTTNWYHIVIAFDTTQSTASNRIRLYVNGSEVTSFDTSSYSLVYPTEDSDTLVNTNVTHYIGRLAYGAQFYLDAYLADYNFIDGSQLAPASFGELKNGTWIPIDTSGLTFGTNGFRLQFKQTGTGTASTSTIGADTSGENHHWTSNNLSDHDSNLLDCPENNFCVMKSASVDHQNRGTPSDGNLVITNAGSVGWGVHTATFAVNSGKWWYEACASGSIGIGYNVGYQNVDTYHNATTDGKATGSFFYYGVDGVGAYYYVGTSDSGTVDNDIVYYTGADGARGTTFVVGDVLGIALDLDADPPTVQHYVNGVAGGPAREIPEGNTLTPYLGLYSANAVTTFNFGADPTFGGISVDGSSADATDSEGNGKFYDTPPSGFLALCSANLPKLAISPAQSTQATDHFNTIIWSGNGSFPRALTGVGFQPDWVWEKTRNQAYGHGLFDSSRGANAGALSSQNTQDEGYANTNFDLDSFDSDGITWAATGDTSTSNNSGDTYVAWNWKANGGTTTTNDASSTGVGTIDSVYQANTDAGFSIITYTGTGSNGTIAHGLGAVPKMMIAKRRDSTSHWVVYHQDLTDASYWLALNLNNAQDVEATHWNSTAPTSTLINLGSNTNTNGSSATYVIYAFTDVEGYSKFGSFVGNNLLDGPFIYTGFKPAWIMAKRSDSTSDWFLLDNKRSPENVVGGGGVGQLAANQNYAESSLSTYAIVDFLSNGFKMRSDMNYGYWNASGGTYIYMAFAEQPFKFSNAR